MHLSSIDKMKQFVDRYLVDKKNQQLHILDLGATDIGGCYRPLFDQAQWHYQGADLVPGNNIDIVWFNYPKFITLKTVFTFWYYSFPVPTFSRSNPLEQSFLL